MSHVKNITIAQGSNVFEFVNNGLYQIGDERRQDNGNVFYLASFEGDQVWFQTAYPDATLEKTALPEGFYLDMPTGQAMKWSGRRNGADDVYVPMGYDLSEIHPIYEN